MIPFFWCSGHCKILTDSSYPPPFEKKSVHWLASIADLLELWLEAAATSFSDSGRGDSPLAQLARETRDNSLLTRLEQYRSAVEESCAGTDRAGQTLERISRIVETIRFKF